MAFTINPGDILQYTFRGVLYGQVTMTTWHYQFTGVSIIADGAGAAQDIADAMQLTTGLWTRYVNVMPQVWTGGQIWAQKIYNARYRKEVYTPTVTAGIVNDQPASPADAIAITFNADPSGPHSIGTKHLPGVVPSSLQNGELKPAAKDGYSLLALSGISTITIGGGLTFDPVIYNRQAPATSLFITGATVQDEARTQRRRVVRRGI